MSKPDLFEQIGDVWRSSENITTATKPASVYMTSRFVSLSEAGFYAADELNRKIHLPEWAALPFLKYVTPKYANPPRNKYPKKLVSKHKETDKRKKALRLIQRTFTVNEEHSNQILELLKQQGVNLER